MRFPFYFLSFRCPLAWAIWLAIGGQLWSVAVQAQRAPVQANKNLPVVTLAVGTYLIKAEVAARESDREQGLMFRPSLKPNAGMLFVFDETAGHCFWMKNTKIPLAIAFIDERGIITDIDEMQADTMNHHCPTRAGRYALEMNSEWFTSRGIKPGALVNGLPH